MNKINKQLNKAWLIKWGFHAQNEKAKLAEYGIKNKIVTFLGPRKSFDDCMKYIEDLYILNVLSYSEKLNLELYKDGSKNRRDLFKTSVPVMTPHKTELYRNMMESLRTNGLDSYQYKKLSDEWRKVPSYIIIGNNPYIEAVRVYNLSVSNTDVNREIIEWEEISANGLKLKMNSLLT